MPQHYIYTAVLEVGGNPLPMLQMNKQIFRTLADKTQLIVNKLDTDTSNSLLSP